MAGTERESLLEIVERFKNGLMSRATGGDIDPLLYRDARKSILGAPAVADVVPRFLRTCHNPDEFWSFIKNEYGTYADRRAFIAAQLNPLLDRLDSQDKMTSAELVLGERLGAGGFGTVYRVKHKILQIDFAVKVFEPSFDDGNQPDLDRFFREARVLFTLHHPNIVRIHDAGFIGRKPFIRMECFEGLNLNDYLMKHGPMPPRKARVLAGKVADAMSHAHRRSVVHRDIKPSNVMVATGEDVRVVDFGLGAFVEADLVSRITKTGERAVGGYYTAPELIANPRLLSPSSDVYSIGAVWFTALTGRPPAGSDLAARLDEMGSRETLLPVLRRCLASQETRFADATEMLRAMAEP